MSKVREKDFICGDCMKFLPDFPNKYFDVAIVDPPYFSGPEKRAFYGRRISPIGVQRLYKTSEQWDIPQKEYFDQLFRVSKNQIIWGGNYFHYEFPAGRIVWDKCNENSCFSDCEIAVCSFHDSVRLFRYMWNVMMQGKNIEHGDIQQGNKKLNEKRIHPTQKPVNLYRWICQKYLQKGMKVLDTHVGSASSLIAYEEYGLEYVGYEINEDYYNAACKRLKEFRSQLTLFDMGMEVPE